LESNDNIPYNYKKKLLDWLVDTNLFRENTIKVEDIPEVFENGVILADLVNRLEGVI